MPGAEVVLGRARLAATSGKHALALRLVEQAQAEEPEPWVWARAEVTRAYVEAETGDPAAGVERCRRVIADEALDPLTHGKAWQQLGLLLMRTGEAEESMAALAQAIAILPEGSDDRGYAFTNRGNVHLQQGRPAAAAADFAAALGQLHGPSQELDRAKAEHNLGYAQLLTGDLVGALRRIDSAAEILSPVSAVNRATIEQDRAEVLTAAGRPHEAVRALQAAAAAYGSRRLRIFQAECELSLAATLLRSDPVRSRTVARRAARRFRDQASPARALRADAAALSAEIAAGARKPSTFARATELAAQLHDQGASTEATLLELLATRVAVRRGELDRARETLRRARVSASSPIQTRLLSREVRAELARSRGDAGRAQHHVSAGLADLHEWQSSFGSLDLQSTLVGHGRDLARMG
ncbi:MAG: hypothetical protein JOZ82_09090, partial [Marmoricola sp.]|nr:hypothetical protein [Marmoricola sp.]